MKAIISDFSRTLLFPVDKSYTGSLNQLYSNVVNKPGFNFFNCFAWNQPLADLYRGLSEKYKIYIFTTDKIQNDPALIPFLDNIFSGMFTLTNTNGFKKDESESYKLLCKKIGLSPSDILYIDDSDINVKAASRAGLHTILYSQDKKVDSEIQKIFIG